MKNFILLTILIILTTTIGFSQVSKSKSLNAKYSFNNGKYGFVNVEGKEVLPFIYDAAKDFVQDIAPVKSDGFWKFIDRKGNEIDSIRLNRIDLDYPNHWLVKKDDKWGIYYSDGKLVAPIIYKRIQRFYGNPYFHVALDDGWGCIDSLNNIIVPLSYRYRVDIVSKNRFIITPKLKKGLIGLNQKVILPPIYDEIIPFNKKVFFVKKEDSWNLVDSLGQVMDLDFQNIYVHKKANIALLQNNGLWGAFNKQLQPFLPMEYEHLKYDSYNSVFKAKKESKWSLLNQEGQEIIPFEYDFLEEIPHGYKLKKGGLSGIVDKKGREVIPLKMDSLLHRRYNWVNLNGKWNYINKQKKFVFPLPFDHLEVMDRSGIRIERNNKWGVANSKGEIIQPLIYDLPLIKFGKDILVKKDGQYGIIDSYGKLFRSVQYKDYIFSKDSTMMILEKSGKFGLLKNNRALIIPFSFDHLSFTTDGKIKGKLKNSVGFFDKEGNVLEGIDESSTSFYNLLTKDLDAKSLVLKIGNEKIIIKSIDKEKLKIKERLLNVKVPTFKETTRSARYIHSTEFETRRFLTPTGDEEKKVNNLGKISFKDFKKVLINLFGEFPFYLQQIDLTRFNSTKSIGRREQRQIDFVKNTKVEEKSKIKQILSIWEEQTHEELSKGENIYIEKATFYSPFYKKSFFIEHLYFQLK